MRHKNPKSERNAVLVDQPKKAPVTDTKDDPEELFIRNFKNICKASATAFASGKSVRSSSVEGQIAVSALQRFARRVQRIVPVPDGCSVLISKGQSNLPTVLWVAVTKDGRLVSDGPSVAVCFGYRGDGAVAGLMDSATFRSAGLPTIARSASGKKIIDVDGPKTKYNDHFVNPLEIGSKEKSAKPFIAHLRKSIAMLLDYYARAR